MIGQTKEKPWVYAFDCRNCTQLQPIGDAMYCMPLRNGSDPMHADDDRVLRCDKYTPAQISMIEDE